MGEVSKGRAEPRRPHRVVPESWNRVAETVIGAALEVHSTLGPGLLERLYEDALVIELGLRRAALERQLAVRVRYKGIELSEQPLDLVVEGVVVVELKAVEAVPSSMLAQLVSYLRSADKPLGLLINFHGLRLKDHIYRRINPDSTMFTEPSVCPVGSDQGSSPRLSASSASSAFLP